MRGIAGTGLCARIPVLLQINQNETYKKQALFSIVTWLYSLKMLWAPLVHALYVQKMGKRKILANTMCTVYPKHCNNIAHRLL
ncbi:acetyl-coenzyme A transporter 1-like [Aphis craccivora]|uniref:Acetyl-coenzyme A transporter 1-like n=1 Tax=Aphis craccivora TaxID=307492 RepID=A0A6G0VQ69_APHCR|nr:acetyl-coenzyme A transporter 1-like [Aphis craccivora]